MAGFKSGMVWRLPPTAEASADFAWKVTTEANKSLKTPAFAVAGITVPVIKIREIKETATRAARFELYFTPRRLE
ncbi:MAG TPA: hypothetical protein VJH69_02355 [Candidatus Paceibacterota bacterium]